MEVTVDDGVIGDGVIGEIPFNNDNQTGRIGDADPGLIPGEITVRSERVELQ